MKLGQLIKMERQKNNMKQEVLARGICSPSYLSKIENDTVIPGEEIQQGLLQRLNISIKNSFPNQSPQQFNNLMKRFEKVINQRDKCSADLLYQENNTLLDENPFFTHKVNLLLMEVRLLLMTSSNFTNAKSKINLLLPMQADMTHMQLFLLYICQGIIAYTEKKFSKALQIFIDAHELTTMYPMKAWEMAEINYVLSLAALSDYQYTLVINHIPKALTFFNSKMLATRSI